jgi:glycosyltransferase involved in cell wall biosynthesis
MRIALLTTYLAVGDETDSGIGQHFRILADALTTQGHEVEVYYLCDVETATITRRSLAVLAPGWTCTLVTAPLPGWLMKAGARSWPFQMLLKHLALAWAGRRAVLASHRAGCFDVVETHSYNFPGLFLVSDRKRPSMLTRVSTTTGQMVAISPMRSRVLRWEAKLENFAIRQSDVLVTHTLQHRDALWCQEGLDPARFAIVPHGIPDPGDPPPRARDPAGGMEFLFVGRFEHRKGIDVLLAAIPTVARACPETRFTLPVRPVMAMIGRNSPPTIRACSQIPGCNHSGGSPQRCCRRFTGDVTSWWPPRGTNHSV